MNKLLGGMFAGSLIGIAVYGMTHYVPAIGFGPLLGVLAGLALHLAGPKSSTPN